MCENCAYCIELRKPIKRAYQARHAIAEKRVYELHAQYLKARQDMLELYRDFRHQLDGVIEKHVKNPKIHHKKHCEISRILWADRRKAPGWKPYHTAYRRKHLEQQRLYDKVWRMKTKRSKRNG